MEILVILLIGFIIMVIYLAISTGKRKMKLEEEGYDVKKANLSGSSLVGGHPDIDAALKNVCFISNSSQIAICDMTFTMKANIAKQSIKDVTFEDATTFGKRISAGRLLLVGIFALAWKKKSKNENAYVVIEWSDGRFEHSTSFLFEGKGSAQKANTTRNWLIKELR